MFTAIAAERLSWKFRARSLDAHAWAQFAEFDAHEKTMLAPEFQHVCETHFGGRKEGSLASEKS
jgi:hypothetical protein